VRRTSERVSEEGTDWQAVVCFWRSRRPALCPLARSLHVQCMMSDRRLTDRRETPFAVIRTLCIATRDGDDGVRSPVLRASFSLPQAPDLVRSRACTAATLSRTLYALRVLSLDNDSLTERSRLIDWTACISACWFVERIYVDKLLTHCVCNATLGKQTRNSAVRWQIARRICAVQWRGWPSKNTAPPICGTAKNWVALGPCPLDICHSTTYEKKLTCSFFS